MARERLFKGQVYSFAAHLTRKVAAPPSAQLAAPQSCPAVQPAGKAVSLLTGAAPPPYQGCTIHLKINNTGKSEDAERKCNFTFDFSSSGTLPGNPQLRHKQKLRDSKVPFIPLLQADLSKTQTDPSTSSSSSSLSFSGNMHTTAKCSDTVEEERFLTTCPLTWAVQDPEVT